MSFFDKMKASIGIGAVKVDTKLEKDRYTPGEEVKGVVEMVGGKVEQTINAIRLHLMTEVKKEGSDDKEYYAAEAIHAFTVSPSFVIQKGENKKIPFSLNLPLNTPVTLGQTKVWIHTEVDIPLAIDQKDRDHLNILPVTEVKTIIQAMEQIGFQLRKVDCEYKYGVVQEFEFYPYSGKFKGYLDEVELVFDVRSDGVNLRMQVDRRARGLGSLLGEALNMDETNTGLSFSKNELNQGVSAVAEKLETVITKYARY